MTKYAIVQTAIYRVDADSVKEAEDIDIRDISPWISTSSVSVVEWPHIPEQGPDGFCVCGYAMGYQVAGVHRKKP